MIDINILVFCHRNLITLSSGKYSGHWNLECFLDTIDLFIRNTYGGSYDPRAHNLIFQTIDVKSGGNYVDDGFSLSFCQRFQGQFDLVYLPDCGGQWYHLQEAHNYEEFRHLLNNVLLLINSHGVIWTSKFIYPEFKTLVEQFQRQRLVFNSIGKQYDEYVCSCGYQTYTPIY